MKLSAERKAKLLIESLDNLRKQTYKDSTISLSFCIYDTCSMTLPHFVELFPYLYEYVWFDGENWWFIGTNIKIEFKEDLPKDNMIFYNSKITDYTKFNYDI